jgi:YggT family protein
MGVVLIPVIEVVEIAIQWYIYAVVIMAIASWLVAFNVINTRNRAVYMILDVLNRITEPALKPIRRFVPTLSGMDISPVILILVLVLIQRVLARLVFAIPG